MSWLLYGADICSWIDPANCQTFGGPAQGMIKKATLPLSATSKSLGRRLAQKDRETAVLLEPFDEGAAHRPLDMTLPISVSLEDLGKGDETIEQRPDHERGPLAHAIALARELEMLDHGFLGDAQYVGNLAVGIATGGP